MGKRLKLVGQKFGRLEVIEFVNIKRIGKQGSASMWKCKCDCGGEIITHGSSLVRGNTTSCGCYRMETNRINITGKKFNRLLVIDYAHTIGKSAFWEVRCDCGIEKIINGNSLRNGHTQSCGCLQREIVSKPKSEEHKRKIGEGNRGKILSQESKEKISKSKIGKMVGSDHPMWNPNLTEEDRIRDRHLYGYADWGYLVKKKCNFTCQKCNQIGGALNSHHIFSYRSNEDLRMDIDNGTCFCKTCHIEFHGIYGYGDNTLIQLEEFLMGGTQNCEIHV